DRQLEERARGAERAPRVVHVRLRLEQGDAPAADPQLRQLAAELGAEGDAVAPGQLVDDHPADVVPVTFVLPARVAEADHEQVERRGALAPTEERHALLLGFAGGLRGALRLGRSLGLARGLLALGGRRLFLLLLELGDAARRRAR